MPISLATQEAEIKRTMVRSQPQHAVCKTLSQKKKKKNITKKGYEWLKVQALSSNPSAAKK
jgi:hypothetical protein